jgi:AraC family transcriptional regulator, activator of mtrCDE
VHDPLSDVLRLVRLTCCVYFLHEFRAPWSIAIDHGCHAQFHLAVQGTCCVQHSGQTLQVEAGEVLLFPRGAQHLLADSDVADDARSGIEVVSAIQAGQSPFGGKGPATRLLCGHFACDSDLAGTLFDGLPDLVRVRTFDAMTLGLADSVVPLLVREMAGDRPGNDIIVERLAEVLLIEVLHRHVEQAETDSGILAAMRDARLARAISAMHGKPHHPWSLEELAREAGMSRSAFAQVFHDVAGTAPGAYLTNWRMLRARELLRDTDRAIIEIAERVGYGSELTFARAFQRAFDVTPARFRRVRRQEPSALAG